MSTVTIQIGNSDNKLGQNDWARFIKDIKLAIGNHCGEVHFSGGSSYDAPWQNACFVAEIAEIDKERFIEEVRRVKSSFFQESVAVTFGDTLMV